MKNEKNFFFFPSVLALILFLSILTALHAQRIHQDFLETLHTPQLSRDLYVTAVQDILTYKRQWDCSGMEGCQTLFLDFTQEDFFREQKEYIVQQVESVTGYPSVEKSIEDFHSAGYAENLYIDIHVHKIGLDYIRLNIMSFGCDIGGRGFEGFYQYDSLSQSWQLKKTTYHWVS
jgi:hypothetical protein